MIPHKCGTPCALTPVTLKLPLPPNPLLPPAMLSSQAGSQKAHRGRPGENHSEIQEARQECTFCSGWIARDFRGPFSCLLSEEFYFGAGGERLSTQLFGTHTRSTGLSHPSAAVVEHGDGTQAFCLYIWGLSLKRLLCAHVFEHLVLRRWRVSGRCCGDSFSCPLESSKTLGESVRAFLNRVNLG